jgi:hypothetical protein
MQSSYNMKTDTRERANVGSKSGSDHHPLAPKYEKLKTSGISGDL